MWVIIMMTLVAWAHCSLTKKTEADQKKFSPKESSFLNGRKSISSSCSTSTESYADIFLFPSKPMNFQRWPGLLAFFDGQQSWLHSDGLIQCGHRGRQIKDSSCSQLWNTSLNNDNSYDREQAGYWLDTKATLTGRKWSISGCYYCLIVSICWFQKTEECVWRVSVCVCMYIVGTTMHLNESIKYGFMCLYTAVRCANHGTSSSIPRSLVAAFEDAIDEGCLTSLQCQSCTF